MGLEKDLDDYTSNKMPKAIDAVHVELLAVRTAVSLEFATHLPNEKARKTPADTKKWEKYAAGSIEDAKKILAETGKGKNANEKTIRELLKTMTAQVQQLPHRLPRRLIARRKRNANGEHTFSPFLFTDAQSTRRPRPNPGRGPLCFVGQASVRMHAKHTRSLGLSSLTASYRRVRLAHRAGAHRLALADLVYPLGPFRGNGLTVAVTLIGEAAADDEFPVGADDQHFRRDVLFDAFAARTRLPVVRSK